MNELNLNPAATTGHGAERTAIVANRTAPGATLTSPRGIVSAPLQRGDDAARAGQGRARSGAVRHNRRPLGAMAGGGGGVEIQLVHDRAPCDTPLQGHTYRFSYEKYDT